MIQRAGGSFLSRKRKAGTDGRQSQAGKNGRGSEQNKRELLKKVRAGEVSLASLPLPVFESEEEREERMKALEEALKAEEEGKEL